MFRNVSFVLSAGLAAVLFATPVAAQSKAQTTDPDAAARAVFQRTISQLRRAMVGSAQPHQLREFYRKVKKIAGAGYHSGMHLLGIMHLAGVGTPANPHKAVRWFKKASAKKFLPSTLLLSMLQVMGHGTPKAPMRGARAAKRAARSVQRLGRKGDASARQLHKDLQPFLTKVVDPLLAGKQP